MAEHCSNAAAPVASLPPKAIVVDDKPQLTRGPITDWGEITDDSTAEFLKNYMAELRNQPIVRVYTALPRDA